MFSHNIEIFKLELIKYCNFSSGTNHDTSSYKILKEELFEFNLSDTDKLAPDRSSTIVAKRMFCSLHQ